MQRQSAKQNMPNEPHRTGVQGAAHTTPVLARRVIDSNRRASSRSLRSQVDADAHRQNSHVNLQQDLTDDDAQSRLLSRRKLYSQNKVPTIALDEPHIFPSNPYIPVKQNESASSAALRSPQPLKQDSYSGSHSPLYSTSPQGVNMSSVNVPNTDFGNTTQRALSASPSKVAQSTLVIRPQARLTNSAGSMESVGPPRALNYHYPGKLSTQASIARSPLCTPSDTSPMPITPSTTHSTSSAALSPSSAHRVAVSPNGLVQQRSTESHESSISMPSATSSGSGGFLFALGRGKITRLGSKEMTRSAENPPVSGQGDNPSPHSEKHPVQRRSSYEMATGKLDPPQRKSKHSSWKHAYKVLKEKRDAFLGKNYKDVDDSNELSDPVYHLLRCAANRDHQPSTCKCICHMEEFGSNLDLLEISSPISVLFSPTNKSRSAGRMHTSSKHKLAQSKSPSSLPVLYPDEENSPLADSHWHEEEQGGKKSHFSLPNILHRRRHHLTGRKSSSGTRAPVTHAQSFDSPRSTARSHSRNPVFTFD